MSWGIELHSGSLPTFAGEEWEDCISAWANLEQHEGMVQLAKGAVLAKVETKYGEGSLEKFADDVGVPYNTAQGYAWVYRRLGRLENLYRSRILDALTGGNLYYTHVLRASSVKEDEVFVSLLTRAQDEGWKARRIAEEVQAHKAGLPAPSEEKVREAEEASTAGASLLDGLPQPERDRLAQKGLEQERAEFGLRLVESEEILEGEVVEEAPNLPTIGKAELTPEQRAYYDLFPVFKRVLELDPEAVAAAAPDAEGARLAKQLFEGVVPWVDRFFGSLSSIRRVK